jgi:hypothetical protein
VADLNGGAELMAFADELRQGARLVQRESRAIATRAGVQIKRDAVKNLRAQQSGRGSQGRSSLWRLPKSISYDVTESGDGWMVEVGPDQSISGLGEGVELGSRHHAPMPFLFPAYEAEIEKVEAAADALINRAFFRGHDQALADLGPE